MVQKWNECPDGMPQVKDALQTPQIHLGTKCCIRLLAYDYSWYQSRYRYKTYPCREALKAIQAYLAFVDTLATPQTGVIALFSKKLIDLKQILIPANRDLNSWIKSSLIKLNSKSNNTGKIALEYTEATNCSSINDQYQKIL